MTLESTALAGGRQGGRGGGRGGGPVEAPKDAFRGRRAWERHATHLARLKRKVNANANAEANANANANIKIWDERKDEAPKKQGKPRGTQRRKKGMLCF